MKKTTLIFLASVSVIHFALFVTHANQSPYLWAIDLVLAAFTLIYVVVNTLPEQAPKKAVKRKPGKVVYSNMATNELLKALQGLNEQEATIEKELELRYTGSKLMRV